MSDNKQFYASFGTGQTFANTYISIVAPSLETARLAMFNTFGDKFCTVYDENIRSSKYFHEQAVFMRFEVTAHDEYYGSPTQYIETKVLNVNPDALEFCRARG
jgi:hypothetical protein